MRLVLQFGNANPINPLSFRYNTMSAFIVNPHDSSLAAAVDKAAEHLPEGWAIDICIERGSGVVILRNSGGDDQSEEFYRDERTLAEEVLDAVAYAKSQQPETPCTI